MRSTKPQNMSSKLLLEVGEPTSLYESFDRSTIDQKIHSYIISLQFLFFTYTQCHRYYTLCEIQIGRFIDENCEKNIRIQISHPAFGKFTSSISGTIRYSTGISSFVHLRFNMKTFSNHIFPILSSK